MRLRNILRAWYRAAWLPGGLARPLGGALYIRCRRLPGRDWCGARCLVIGLQWLQGDKGMKRAHGAFCVWSKGKRRKPPRSR